MPTLTKYDPVNFSQLMNLNPLLTEKRLLEAYGIISSNYVTYLGGYFQNDSKLILSLGEQKLNFWNIDNLIELINQKYLVAQNTGLIRTSAADLYGNKLEEIIRELLSNAITHSLIGGEIDIFIDKHSIVVSNDVLENELISIVNSLNKER